MRAPLIAISLLFFLKTEAQLDQVNRLQQIYDSCNSRMQFECALRVAKQMNQYLYNTDSDTSLRYAISFRFIGNSFSDLRIFDSAICYYNKSLDILNKQKRTSTIDASYCFLNIGNVYLKRKNYKQSLIYFPKAQNPLGEKHSLIADISSSIGVCHYYLAQYNLAKTYYMDALDIYMSLSPDNNSRDVARILNNLGALNSKLGEYILAESQISKAINIDINIFGRNHHQVAEDQIALANLYIRLGNYESAEPVYKEALEIFRNSQGRAKYVALCLQGLGVVYGNLGDFKTAETVYKEALEIFKVTDGEYSRGVADILNNLGLLFSELGDYQSSEKCYMSAFDILKNIHEADHPDFLGPYLNIANLYSDKKDFKQAKIYYNKYLANCKMFFPQKHNYVSLGLSCLGNMYSRMHDYEKSKNYYKQALDMYKNNSSNGKGDYATCLNNLGIMYLNMGDYKAAEPFLRQAMQISNNIFGNDHSDYIRSENLYAEFLYKTSQEQAAYFIFSKNFSKKTKEIANNFEWLGENQKESYWKKESLFYDNLSSYANEVYKKVPESVGLNFNAALLTKSKLLESKISTENYYREIDDLRRELTIRRRLLAKLESEGSFDQNRLSKLRFEADSLDKRLTLSWPEYAQQKKNLSITWEQVQQNLGEGEAAIEFVRYKNDDSLFYYNALVLKKGDLYPVLVKLCKEVDLKAITPMFGSSEYYHLIWKPLDSVLLGVKTIFYAPVGELNNVPFHSIKFNDQVNEYLMDHYTLHQLTSTRYLALGLKQKEESKLETTVSMVGGVNYNYLPGMHSEPDLVNKDGLRSEIALGKLEYLPGTKTEVEHIASILTSNGWKTKLLSNNDAKEEDIVKMEGKDAPSILHLATHGYAFPEFDFKDTTINTGSLRYSYRYSTNSMVRSGLILTGGNWAWTGSDTLTKMGAEQNGILTALEVSQLNLKKTKLVVLSACETGLGKIEGSEGTFGLKRAFKLAGVEQMIVSLWPVPDKETGELMTLFYNDMVTSLNPIISFAKAQKAMRDKYPNSPQTWAGFVLVR